MYAKFFFCFVGLCVVNKWLVEANDDRVDQMNVLLANSGWHVFQHQLIIDNDRLYDVNEILAQSTNDQTVTPENVENKLRQIHQLLSCSYASLLMHHDDYITALGIWCKRMKRGPIQVKLCWNSLLLQMKDSNKMVEKMISALQYFQQLSTQTAFSMYISNLLFYRISFFVDSEFDIEKYVDNHSMIVLQTIYTEHIFINDIISLVTITLQDFLKQKCLLSPSNIHNPADTMSSTLASQTTDPNINPSTERDKLLSMLDNIIKNFDQVYYTNLGFVIDEASKKSKIRR